MRFEGQAPLYSGFALVAIESIWPNPEGGELTPDDYDLRLLGEENNFVKGGGFKRASFSKGSASEATYNREQGYYKIFPLNVLSVNTSSSTDGNSFEVKFTLDDILLVTSEDNAEVMSNATGLPVNRTDLASMEEFLPMFSPAAGMKFVRDESLGLARYRISGPNSGFNIEDLVTANDTVTIWIYHDPQEFLVMTDDVTEIRSKSVVNDKLAFEHGLQWVIGSGDRRGQYATDVPTFNEYILGVVGLTDEYMESSLQAAVDGEEKPIKGVTSDNIYKTVVSFLNEALAGSEDITQGAPTATEGVVETSNKKLKDMCNQTFGTEDGIGEKIYNWLMNPLLPPDKEPRRDGMTPGATTAELRRQFKALTDAMYTMPDGRLAYKPTADLGAINTSLLPAGTELHSESILTGANLFTSVMNKKLTEHLAETTNRRIVTRSKQNFSNGRTILTSGDGAPFHGETPYLALKGHVSSVKTTVGTVQGSHTVTISGRGLEKPLNEHEVFYEMSFAPDGSRITIDFNAIYVNMTPPQAALTILNRHAPKQIMLGSPGAFVNSVTHAYYRPLNQEELEALSVGKNDVEVRVLREWGEEVTLRGNFIATRGEEDVNEGAGIPQKTLIFTPLNYVDGRRIREMVNVINDSYEDPEVAGRIRTPRYVNNREPVLQNMKRAVGVGELYEMFVDETGRVRFRVTFEAMERTPQPLYTPIIQDTDILAEGATFEHSDSQLKTVVDVMPVGQATGFPTADMGWAGRSIPPESTVPFTEIPDGVPPKNISADMFRYGLRSQTIDEIYFSERLEARRKAILYRGFYGQPIKTANIRVRGSTSYRAGETVLLALQKNKHRSRVPINLDRMLEWFRYLKEDDELIDMYVGADERLLHADYYGKTQNQLFIPSEFYYSEFASNPKKFVLEQFIATFEYLKDTLPGISVLTPEYFPSTYWYARWAGLAFHGWDENSVRFEDTVEMYTALLKSAVAGLSSATNDVKRMYTDSPGVMNSIKFQDFRCASYLINGVSQNFTQDADVSTSLSLNYGQDNLVLLEPRNFLPIGFISLEKKLKIGYDDGEEGDQRFMFQEYPSKKSAIQMMYVSQFKEDKEFKRGNFLYTAQSFRNISNYMHDIALIEGLEGSTTIEETTSEVFNEVPQTPENIEARLEDLTAVYAAPAIPYTPANLVVEE